MDRIFIPAYCFCDFMTGQVVPAGLPRAHAGAHEGAHGGANDPGAHARADPVSHGLADDAGTVDVPNKCADGVAHAALAGAHERADSEPDEEPNHGAGPPL